MIFTLPAPAKLNLFLHIVGRRSDGYHDLQTVFQFLDFSDSLSFELRQDSDIRLFDLNCSIEKNLVWRAAKLLQSYTQITAGADICLQKNIPIGAGLGGGSSDAATTLVALNQLWQTELSVDVLAELGLQLGADVPIFVRGTASWAEGIGEKLTPIDLPENWYLVLISACSVATAEIFSHPQLTRDTSRIRIAHFLSGSEVVRNDFEPLVRRLYPPVAEALDWLGQFAPARLTGSGSAIFASFANQEEAERVFTQKPTTMQGFISKGMNRSPLLFELDKMQKR